MSGAQSRVAKYFADYEGYHRTPENVLTHVVGIPLIVVSLLGLLNEVLLASCDCTLGTQRLHLFSAAFVLWAFANLFYLWLEWRLGVLMILTTLACWTMGTYLPVRALWAFFVLGWVFQLVGHAVFEKKSPAFTKNLLHILIGPVFVINYWIQIVKRPYDASQ